MKSYYWAECALVAFNILSFAFLFDNSSKPDDERTSRKNLLIMMNLIFVLLSIVKWRFEGWRMISIVSLLSQSGNNLYALWDCQFSAALALIINLVHFYSIFFFKIRPLHNPRGKHHVGFTTFSLNKTTSCSIFYPCIERRKKIKPKWLPFEDYWQRMHDTHKKDVSKPGKAPPFFFQILHGLYEKDSNALYRS